MQGIQCAAWFHAGSHTGSGCAGDCRFTQTSTTVSRQGVRPPPDSAAVLTLRFLLQKTGISAICFLILHIAEYSRFQGAAGSMRIIWLVEVTWARAPRAYPMARLNVPMKGQKQIKT